MRINKAVCIGIAMVGLAGSMAWACRYNVRDVGFVNFESAAYRLYGYTDRTVPDPIKTSFQQLSFAALLDSNVVFEHIDLDAQSDRSAMNYFNTDNRSQLPSLVLVSPKGQSISIPVPPSDESFKDALWETVESLVDSELRRDIVTAAIQSYCVILLVEGTDPLSNARARDQIQQVITRVKENMASLPKAIDHPPAMIGMPHSTIEQERVLMWSLGIEPSDRPQAAVIYGRARKIGDILQGGEITVGALSNIVSVIGLSCECGLDRSWMMGTMIPFRWSEFHRAEVAKRLGFDPESPMVKTEISQIMSTNTSRQVAGGSSSTSDSLLGYGEFTISSDASEVGLIEFETIDSNYEEREPVEGQSRSLSQSQSISSESIPAPRSDFEVSQGGLSNQADSTRTYWTTIGLMAIAILLASIAGGFYVIMKTRGTLR